MSKPEITILILGLYKVRPHTGLLTTYQLSRRLNMISLRMQLTWDKLTRKFGYPTHKLREKCKQQKQITQNFNNQQLIDFGLNLSDYKFREEHKGKYKKTYILRAPWHPSRSDETPTGLQLESIQVERCLKPILDKSRP